MSNLQVLCEACHLIKTSNEHKSGQYNKVSDTESTFNTQVQDVMNSSLSQTHAFNEKAYYNELQSDQTMFTIDIYKCRKIYYIMDNLILVFSLYLIRLMNLKVLTLYQVYIMLKLIMTCL
jgi:hypothetical protein